MEELPGKISPGLELRSELFEEPEDFDEFWLQVQKDVAAAKLKYRRDSQNEFSLAGFKIDTLSFETPDGRVLNGWISLPEAIRHAPAFLWINPYGRESLLPNEYGTRPGFVSFNVNFFEYPAFYQEKYVPSRDYMAEGIEDPENFIFRRLIKDSLLALRVLQAQLEVDEDRIAVMGMSQGGGLSLACGALSSIPKAVCADMPFFGDIRSTLDRPVHRYPLKSITDFIENAPIGRERAFNTLSYYDTVSFARRCLIPTHISLGFKDPSCRPPTVEKIYAALNGEKLLSELDWGHDWHPSMISENQAWMERYL